MCKREGGSRGALQGGSFAPLSRESVNEASHFGYMFSKSEYLRKAGVFSETDVGGHGKE